MCNQQGHVNCGKANDTAINFINTEKVIIIDDYCFKKAKLNELNKWKTNNVYEEIPYNHQNPIYVKCVCTIKETTNKCQKLDLLLKVSRNQQKMKY